MTRDRAPFAGDGAAPPRPPNDCFALPPGVSWTPVEEALARLDAALPIVAAAERTPLAAAAGRFLGQDALATRAHPACDNAAVDGYAFAHPGAAEKTWAAFTLRSGAAAAGRPWPGVLSAGEAVRILTGAPVPAGADTVALQEDATLDAGPDGQVVRLHLPKRVGANRRRRGENLAVGQTALTAGALLTPPALAHLAAGGVADALARRPLRVAVLSTGDELVDVARADAARDDQVIDSNGPMLRALLAETWIDVIDLGRVKDDRAAVEAALDSAAEQADALVTSGGASAGDADHLSAALADAAGEGGGLHLWRIAMKPGRPLALGQRRGLPVFGLPGNPVAAFVCFLLFARPALRKLAGGGFARPTALTATAGFDHPKKPGRREYLRVRLNADGVLEKYRSEGSGLIEGLTWSNGLADLAHDAGPVRAGDPVSYLSYAALGLRT